MGAHLLKRFAVFFIPELLLVLNYVFGSHVSNVGGIPHKTDAALGLAIYTILIVVCWVIYLIVDMIILFRKEQQPKAMMNFYLIIGTIICALLFWLKVK